MQSERVGAVIVHFMGIQTTVLCINDLLEQSQPVAPIVVVVQAQEVGAAKAIHDQFPNVIVLQQSTNTGFPAAIATGMNTLAIANVGVAWITNPDIRMHPAATESLLCGFDTVDGAGRVGAVGPLLTNTQSPETIWAAGGIIGQKMCASNAKAGASVHDFVAQTIQDVDYLPACAMLVKMSAWQDTAGMDASFFLYYEDVDFALRLRQRGWSLRLDPTVIVLHEGSANTGATSDTTAYYMLRNRLITARRWQHPHVFWFSTALDCLRIVLSAAIRRTASRKVLVRALWDGIRLRGGQRPFP